MAKLTAATRKKIPTRLFGVPEDRGYPLEDATHARDALSRSSGKPEHGRIARKVHELYPGMKVKGFPSGKK